jgi:hypothetical protein
LTKEYGYYSGRCFSQFDPNKALNSYLAIIQKDVEGLSGPAFLDAKDIKILEGSKHNHSPSLFDDNPQLIAAMAKKDWSHFSAVESNKKMTYSRVLSRGPKTKLIVKKFGNYLTAAYELEKDEFVVLNKEKTSKARKLKKGDKPYLCYYFKKFI